MSTTLPRTSMLRNDARARSSSSSVAKWTTAALTIWGSFTNSTLLRCDKMSFRSLQQKGPHSVHVLPENKHIAAPLASQAASSCYINKIQVVKNAHIHLTFSLRFMITANASLAANCEHCKGNVCSTAASLDFFLYGATTMLRPRSWKLCSLSMANCAAAGFSKCETAYPRCLPVCCS
jgi:hypothetical protein